MSEEEPLLSSLMVHYPFTPQSRRFFEKLPMEEAFSSPEVLRQARVRLLAALGRTGYAGYEPNISELIEFLSFFAAALVAAQDPYMGQKFAAKEGERAKKTFISERASDKPEIVARCFDMKLIYAEDGPKESRFLVGVEDYLAHVSRFELERLQRWKLVNQPLAGGLVYFGDNALNDLFCDMTEKAVVEGVRNLRKAQLPKELSQLREEILPLLPPPKTKSTRSYLYVEELLKHPVSDGRHRLVWLVLAPYLVNVKSMEEGEAIETIQNYVTKTGDMRNMRRFVDYNVRRAKRNGLMPPTIGKLRAEHPDLYSVLPKDFTAKYATPLRNRKR